MIGPKVCPIEGKRPSSKWDNSDIFNLRRLLLWIESRDSPILIRFFLAAQHIDQAIDEDVTANLCADIYLTDNIGLRIEFQYPMLVPLAQVKISSVEAEI